MMQVTSRSIVHRGFVSMCVAAALAVALATAGQATTLANHPNIITISQPAALPGLVLPPGVYVFEIANPDTDGNVVRVLRRSTHQPLYSGFTRRVDRPRAMPGDIALIFGEAPTGSAASVRAWFPLGLHDGHEFIY